MQLEFPPPNDTSNDLRQAFISLYEDPWPGNNARPGTDPIDYFTEEVTASPGIGKSLCDIGGDPAVCVEPRSPSDESQRNPAFIHVVIGRTSVEIAGGDDLGALKQIGSTLATTTARSG